MPAPRAQGLKDNPRSVRGGWRSAREEAGEETGEYPRSPRARPLTRAV
jgi:hypothetical protein